MLFVFVLGDSSTSGLGQSFLLKPLPLCCLFQVGADLLREHIVVAIVSWALARTLRADVRMGVEWFTL